MRHAVPARGGIPGRELLEGLATGIAYGAGLWSAGSLLVASFRPLDLAMPYWNRLSWLRTDTSGAVAFCVLAISLCLSEYLRLRRKERDAAAASGPRARNPLAVAIAKVVALLSTVLVVYFSVNSVTHPATLAIHATHFASWPTESTGRVSALCLCIISVGWLRFSAARSTR